MVIQKIYHWVLRRHATFYPFMILTAFAAERAVDTSSNAIFNSYNRGVSFFNF